VGLTGGIPIFFGADADGNSFGGLGGGAGLHLDFGFKLSDSFGLGLDLGVGGYGLSDGSSIVLTRTDIGAVTGDYRFGVGLGVMNGDAGPDIYLGRLWQIAGPFCLGVSADYMWDFKDGGTSWVLVNLEAGFQFGDR
jgi:hypothetical protein